jgi:hypothetical protein
MAVAREETRARRSYVLEEENEANLVTRTESVFMAGGEGTWELTVRERPRPSRVWAIKTRGICG